ncbi:MAG: hypothetical protein F9K29_08030 [Hyphomicrobiaceae bacterium]|nr:MAG: hypothetical protein F9K29_08030 [Hyphomicrobiaceae bacterium]
MTDSGHVYPVTKEHPPLRVRVLVQWNNRLYKAARVYHPTSKKLVWAATRGDGSTMYLPPRRKAREGLWAENPEWWRPEQPELWKAPLPAPKPFNGVIKPEGVMVNIRAKPRRRRALVHLPRGPDLPWWWLIDPDAPRLVYQPPGDVTRDMAEGRVMRALSASGAGAWEGLPAVCGSPVLRLTEEVEKFIRNEATRRQEQPASVWLQRLQLDNADRSDWLVAMSWFAALNPPELHSDVPWQLNNTQVVLIWRARAAGGPLSWRAIARELGRTHVRCLQIYEAGIDRVHRAANGLPVFGHIAVADHMKALRERNRGFRRGKHDQ